MSDDKNGGVQDTSWYCNMICENTHLLMIMALLMIRIVMIVEKVDLSQINASFV